MENITDKEAKELGVSKEVYEDWSDVMQALWTASITFFMGMKSDKMFLPKQFENEIYIGELYKIDSIICNNSFIETRLWEGEKQLCEIRYDGNVNTICQCIFIIIKSK